MPEAPGPRAAAPAAPGPPARRSLGSVNRYLPALTVLVAIALVLVGARWVLHRVRYVTTDDAQVKGDLVLVAARHPGTLLEVLVEEGRHVARGEVVARLDARAETAELERARAARERAAAEFAKARTELTLTQSQVEGRRESAATVASRSRDELEQAREDLRLQGERAQRGIERAEAALRAAQARVARSAAERDTAARDEARVRGLFERGAVAEADRDRAELVLRQGEDRLREAREEEGVATATLETARAEKRMVEIKRLQEKIAGASLDRANSDVKLAREEGARNEVQELNVKVLEAALRQAEAAERAAALRLEECAIASPEEGVVARKAADAGETLAAGQPVVVVADLGHLWVEANVKETALRRVVPGAEVAVHVDALPGRDLRGRVSSLNAAANSQYALIPSSNPSGQFIKVTQRVAVRIELEERDPLLRPGMMAEVDIRAR